MNLRSTSRPHAVLSATWRDTNACARLERTDSATRPFGISRAFYKHYTRKP